MRGLVVSSPLPEFQLTLTGPAAAHPGDQVPHTARITNVGAAPAVNVRLTGDCVRDIGTVGAGQTVTVPCPVKAPEDDYRVSATAAAASLAADELTAAASSAVDVLHPALVTIRTATPDTVLTGQTVRYEISVRNSGDTPLAGVSVDDDQVVECRKGDLGTLAPGRQVVVTCAGAAPDADFTATATAGGTDALGKRVTAQGRVTVSVLHPRQAVAPPPPLPRPQPPVQPAAAVRSQLPVPTPIIVLGVATIAMSLTISAVARPKR
ncbi:hypothetical protein GCM10022267_31300 [Lentzea roselyniae]|uniref:DUF7507 domain-containing protein n=1 Tax=Lentzea roselyniae TaxID=531940 RepID=A0ABP7AY82_9PSEU